MFQLKYVAGATPGRPVMKRSSQTTPDEKKEKQRRYEKEVRERQFKESWLIGREWLKYDAENKLLTCTICSEYYEKGPGKSVKLKADARKWINGTECLKKDTIVKHESANYHNIALERQPKSNDDLKFTAAADALRRIRSIDKTQMAYKFRNAHAVAKWDMSFRTYVRLCNLDHAKGLNVNTTYETDKSGKGFIGWIATQTRNQLLTTLKGAKYLSLTVDGSTDTSGIEQESIYIHFAHNGLVNQHFLCFTSPQTTTAADIFASINECLDCYLPGATEKMIGITSDGASNMMGVKKGVAALFKAKNPEIVSIHCLAHRLELGVRDAFKKQTLYDRCMTLLVGLFYFYKKSSKQQKELKRTFEVLQQRAILPTRSGGTRWVAHVLRSVTVLFQGYRGFLTHLANASHSNAKAEGLYKLASDVNVVIFLMNLKEILQPVGRLSLLLQREDTNLGEVLMMKSAALQCLEELLSRKDIQIDEVLASGRYKEFELKQRGNASYQYRPKLIEAVSNEISLRFSKDDQLLEASQLVNFKIWPEPSERKAISEFGDDYLCTLQDRFQSKMDMETLRPEWSLLKSIVYQRYGSAVSTLKWSVVSKALAGMGLDSALDLVDLVLSLPPTSVFNERSFSHMKLMKTDRRSRMKSTTMTDVMTVKLETPDVTLFNPSEAIDLWATSSTRPRRPEFRRQTPGKNHKESETTEAVSQGPSSQHSETTEAVSHGPSSQHSETTEAVSQGPSSQHSETTEAVSQGPSSQHSETTEAVSQGPSSQHSETTEAVSQGPSSQHSETTEAVSQGPSSQHSETTEAVSQGPSSQHSETTEAVSQGPSSQHSETTEAVSQRHVGQEFETTEAVSHGPSSQHSETTEAVSQGPSSQHSETTEAVSQGPSSQHSETTEAVSQGPSSQHSETTEAVSQGPSSQHSETTEAVSQGPSSQHSETTEAVSQGPSSQHSETTEAVSQGPSSQHSETTEAVSQRHVGQEFEILSPDNAPQGAFSHEIDDADPDSDSDYGSDYDSDEDYEENTKKLLNAAVSN